MEGEGVEGGKVVHPLPSSRSMRMAGASSSEGGEGWGSGVREERVWGGEEGMGG